MIVNMSGSGGSGGTLTVTAPAGATITVSKDSKSKTRTADQDGVAVFKGLSTGKWTVSATDGDKTAQKTVAINVDFETVIAFFSATINVTYPAGSTCTASDGVTTLTAPDTTGTWACIVPNTGTWTVTSTNGTDSNSKSVSITSDGQSENVSLSYSAILFDGTSFNNELTGGWTKHGSGSTVSGGRLHVASSNYITSKNKVDLSSFSSIKFTISGYSGYASAGLDIATSISESIVVSTKYVTKNGTYSIDVSKLSGSYYFDFFCEEGTNMNVTYCELVR